MMNTYAFALCFGFFALCAADDLFEREEDFNGESQISGIDAEIVNKFDHDILVYYKDFNGAKYFMVRFFSGCMYL